MNNFVFNDEHFLQQYGTAVGTRMAPAFANLFMGEFEKNGYADKPYPWYITNRFHFAVRLYSDNAQMTSKHGKNEVRYEPQASSVTDVLTMFSRPLCVSRVQTHGKMKSICFIQ